KSQTPLRGVEKSDFVRWGETPPHKITQREGVCMIREKRMFYGVRFNLEATISNAPTGAQRVALFVIIVNGAAPRSR
ncbi:MAG: hypothetical protein JW892_11105, partial [Anaerolineae bacterium]|nr:hypothetical protein [Anaerolineae bacterium]